MNTREIKISRHAMKPIYFIDESHRKNFKEALLRWNVSKGNREYRTACYILAIPIIFEKVERYIGSFETPVDWIWFWEYKYTLSKQPNFKGDVEAVQDVPYDLTIPAILLGRFSLNMWNGYKYFNLYDLLNSLDEELYHALTCAMDIRLGHRN